MPPIETVILQDGYAHYVAEDQENTPYLALIFPDLAQRRQSNYDDFYACCSRTLGWRTLRRLDAPGHSVRYLDAHEPEWRRGYVDFSDEEFGEKLYLRVDGAVGRAPYSLTEAYYARGVSRERAIKTQSLPRDVRKLAFNGVSKDDVTRLVIMQSMFYEYDDTQVRVYLGDMTSNELRCTALRQPIKGHYSQVSDTLFYDLADGHRLILWQVNAAGTYKAVLHDTTFELAPSEGLVFEEEYNKTVRVRRI